MRHTARFSCALNPDPSSVLFYAWHSRVIYGDNDYVVTVNKFAYFFQSVCALRTQCNYLATNRSIVTENTTLQLIQSKCVPALLYGLDACPLNKSDINSLDFVVNQFFMKLFCTSDINIVSGCQLMFNFKIPSEQLAQRKDNFIRRLHCVWCLNWIFCK